MGQFEGNSEWIILSKYQSTFDWLVDGERIIYFSTLWGQYDFLKKLIISIYIEILST